MTRVQTVVMALGVGFILWVSGTLLTDIFMAKLLRFVKWVKKVTKHKPL